jgi:hypothetical protein
MTDYYLQSNTPYDARKSGKFRHFWRSSSALQVFPSRRRGQVEGIWPKNVGWDFFEIVPQGAP